MTEEKKLLNDIVDAWQALRGGINHSPEAIENWLILDMAPIINKARKYLKRKKPHAQ